MEHYVGSGGVKVGGCAIVTKTVFFITKFKVGDIVFNIHKARKGFFEDIAIKKIRLVNTRRTLGQTIPLYVDTLNGLWNENELIKEADAKDIISAYLEDELAELKALALTCRLPTTSS